MQVDFLTELFMACKELNIHTTIDTNGFIEKDKNKLDKLINYTDLVLLSIKHMEPDAHKKITGHTNKYTLDFAEYLQIHSARIQIQDP